MNKTELIVFNYKQTYNEAFQDTYLAPSSYGLVLGLEFSGDVSNIYQVGQVITIDKTNKTINSWADGQAFIVGIEPSGLFPPPGVTVFTNRPLQSPITFSSGEDGIIISEGLNNEYEIYESLDLSDNEPFPLNYNIADIREPEKRNAFFSKTITLPGTKKNNIFFNNIFEVGADSSFDPRKKVRCVVYTEGLEQLNGILQLTSIKRDDYNNISYEVNLQGQLGNIFAEIGEGKLCELGFQEYNHPYVVSAATRSWDTDVKKNGTNYVNWTTGNTQTFIDCLYNNGKLDLLYATPHNYQVGESIFVDKADPTVNHIYNGTAIITDVPNSTTISINRGFGVSTVNESGTTYSICPTGEGYVYGLFEYDGGSAEVIPGGGRKNGWTIEDLYPQLYTKTIVDKIFETIGYTYESEFFNSCFFKRLVVPFTGEYYEKSTLQIQEQEFRAGKTGTTNYNFPMFSTSNSINTLQYNTDFSSSTNPDLYDNNNNYNLSTFRFVSQYNTTMSFQMDLAFQVGVLPFATTPIGFPGYWLWTTIFPDGGDIELGKISHRFVLYRKRNGVLDILNEQIYDWYAGAVDESGIPIPNQQTLIPPLSSGGYLSPTYNITLQANDIDIQIGDEVFPVVFISVSNPTIQSIDANWLTYKDPSIVNQSGPTYTTNQTRFIFRPEGSRFFNSISSNSLREGDTFDFTKFFDCEYKQSDFLLGLIKMFNLYIDDVKGETNKVRIEPRNEYYSQGVRKNWTNKLDISKSFEIIPLGDVLSKDYEFTYKEDADFYNEDYKTKTNKVYANKEFTIVNEFIKDKTTTEVIFSPSPQILNSFNFLSYCRLRKQETNNETGTAVYSRLKANPRILYYGGLLSYAGWDLVNSSAVNRSKFFFGQAIPTTVLSTYEYYPYVGMLDHPLFSYKNLWFGNPVFTYYFINYTSNNNLFNFYHKNYYEEISSKNSKLIKGSFYLNAKDIFELDFRNTIYIDGQYYRLNKIIDYNPLNNAATQVELFKVEDVLLFQQEERKTTNVGNGNGDDPFDDTDIKDPFGQQTIPLDKNVFNVVGRNNFVSSKNENLNIIGDDNKVFDDGYNVNIIGGSQNVVGANARNVTIIGTDGVTVNRSNTTIINGVVYQNGVLISPMNVIDAGRDEVYNLNSSTTTNIFDANEDIVQTIGSSLNNNAIDASLDISYEV